MNKATIPIQPITTATAEIIARIGAEQAALREAAGSRKDEDHPGEKATPRIGDAFQNPVPE